MSIRIKSWSFSTTSKEIIPEAVVEVDGYLMLEMKVLKEYVREAKKELRKLIKNRLNRNSRLKYEYGGDVSTG